MTLRLNMINLKMFLSHGLILSALASWVPIANADEDKALREQALSLFMPLGRDSSQAAELRTEKMIALGRELFFDKRLSANGAKGCVHCHRPEFYGAENPASRKKAGSSGSLHDVPTVLNASLNFANNWYGEEASVESQAVASLISACGLGHANAQSAIDKIKSIPKYQKLFTAIFPGTAEPITAENWGTVMGAYQRTLVTPSPFDAYLAGNNRAISDKAKTGLRRFMDLGCVACHNGVAIGGSGLQKFGVWENYWEFTKSSQIDQGRFNLTKDENDLYVFRIASLRNVSKTAPYFHDGSVKSLPEAVRIMGKIQLRKTLSEADIKHVVAFLHTLTGKLPENFHSPNY